MKKACDINPGTMAAVIGLENEIVENSCMKIKEIVVLWSGVTLSCVGVDLISKFKKTSLFSFLVANSNKSVSFGILAP